MNFIACHGHTVFHQPENAFTCQIGDGETIAAYLTCPLVDNFRNKDVALGGQGAPLVPIGERYLFRCGQYCVRVRVSKTIMCACACVNVCVRACAHVSVSVRVHV